MRTRKIDNPDLGSLKSEDFNTCRDEMMLDGFFNNKREGKHNRWRFNNIQHWTKVAHYIETK